MARRRIISRREVAVLAVKRPQSVEGRVGLVEPTASPGSSVDHPCRRPESANVGTATATRWRDGALPVLLLFAVKLALHLATDGNIGYHQDELYYLDSAKHLQLGYVDYPPMTPLIARLATFLFGGSIVGLRLFAALAGAIVVVLAGLIAAELGGSRRAQILAGLAALTAPLLLGSNWLFQTVSFDQLFWVASLFVFARLLRTGDPRLWLALGVLLGLALETKYTVLVLCAGIAVATLSSRALRAMLRTPYPWLGGFFALAIWAPNLWWQESNGWPTLDYIRAHSADISTSGGITAFVLTELLIVGPLLIPVWLLGWWHLLRERGLRPLGVAALISFLLLLPDGKAYYTGPLFPPVLAAAVVAIDRFAARRSRRWPVRLLAGLLIADALVPFAIVLPLFPEHTIASSNLYKANKDFADSMGWPDVAVEVNSAWRALPDADRAHGVILARIPGVPGAIDRFGPALGLPGAISSDLTYWYWKPAHTDAQTVLAVGYTVDDMRLLFHQVTPVGTLSNPLGVHNEAWGEPLLLCRDPVISLDDAWPSLKNLS